MAKKKGSGCNGKRWEEAIHALELAGYANIARTEFPPSGKWFMRDVYYRTIYNTRGRHEFVLCNERNLLTVECKFQETGGSVDEKLPYLFESWLRSESYQGYPFSRHWLVAFDGLYFQKGRGANAVEWLRLRGNRHESSRRSMTVTNGFLQMLDWLKEWS